MDFAAGDGFNYGMESMKNSCFQDTDDLLEPDLIFLDIELGDKQGIDVAHDLNKHYKDCSIIYLTNYLSYAVDVYETEHIYYVMKEEFQKRLPDIMKKYDDNRKRAEEKTSYTKITVQEIGGPIRTISEESIIFCERNIRETIIYIEDKKIRTREKINSLEELLSNDLFCAVIIVTWYRYHMWWR